MINVVVNKISKEAEGIISLELLAKNNEILPNFSAGSHIDLHLPNGLIRQYSLSNCPSENKRYEIAVLKDPVSRGGSVAVHELRQGEELTISEPRNLFPLVNHASKYKLFAGGIGITPILCMAERLYTIGADFELHYFSKSKKYAAYLNRIEQSPFLKHVFLKFDDERAEDFNIHDVLKNAPDHHLYVCGPSGFMNFILDNAVQCGWKDDYLHKEFFSAEKIDSDLNQEFDIKIASTGDVFTIKKDDSIIEVLGKNGIDIPLSCEQGICGTCITRVLEGEPDHRDMYFSDEERQANNQFLPCCSRSKSKLLILDL
ncbi:PDR/VanB family oxidoreductase [Acinetobacter sichuanensis]|uniref:Oxidoreductase n=1 Tax=Acinetobacter sichuanensis TaxID=2136183 RepID=A0A371YL43_9GAMM|nr:PDR/VanB family oxidoreductase [Acinetobacter sichuanensis]RFC82198.1 oxidoreductase [Acinetobacter sichuanensis]